ncbi:hypothetical protein [Actinomadura macrotermitis]|uniref:Uncharacterized protein n=1 Tax=Actinomadura macrotermitis TaxID=2585200 RepID=A0A7K0BXD3_9ACTN|nr:hypothetical protein [Actinomadura macrotermitis]MQY05845.1 hypothetical protein [Actinomadura macrotermitis]
MSIGGESDAVAKRAGTSKEEEDSGRPHIVPRDTPVDEYTDLPEGLREENAEEPEAEKDDPESGPTEKAGPAS